MTSSVPEYNWHPTERCIRHDMPTALCTDGHYRCLMCTDDKLLRLAFTKKES